MADMPNFIITDADGFAENDGPALLLLHITRNEIEECNWTSSLERLLVMCDTRENVLRYRESLVLNVLGFDDDPRELSEIPEVRQFFAKLANAWPHWIWFLHRDNNAIPLFMSLICEVKIHRAEDQFGTEFIHPDELNRRFGDLLERGIPLFEAYDIPPELAEASAMSAAVALGGE